MNLREQGKQGEEIAKQHYQSQGYTLLEQNFTIRWGEIDLLMKKEKTLIAIEIKIINHFDDLDQCISTKKIWFLHKTLQYYLQNTKESTFHEIRMDAVFIKNNKIVEIYEDITNT